MPSPSNQDAVPTLSDLLARWELLGAELKKTRSHINNEGKSKDMKIARLEKELKLANDRLQSSPQAAENGSRAKKSRHSVTDNVRASDKSLSSTPAKCVRPLQKSNRDVPGTSSGRVTSLYSEN